MHDCSPSFPFLENHLLCGCVQETSQFTVNEKMRDEVCTSSILTLPEGSLPEMEENYIK